MDFLDNYFGFYFRFDFEYQVLKYSFTSNQSINQISL